ncbi:MAG: DMT family transporter [Betaproteobacteria bacterium]|nr:DMT family transporter [Betaproteobacteria bacterium]
MTSQQNSSTPPAPALGQAFGLGTMALLMTPPLLWAGNALVARLLQDLVPPIMLNLLRWSLVFVLLIPLGGWVLRFNSPLWRNWPRYMLLGFLGMGCYNTLLYLALQTSSPINVTLVSSAIPLFTLLMGRLFYGQTVARLSWLGVAASMVGVMVVLGRGDLDRLLALSLVPGDLLMVLASILWAWYSWLLARPWPGQADPEIQADWAANLQAQTVMGLAWCALFAGLEGFWLGHATGHSPAVTWSWPLVLGVLYVAVGPAILAYRCWGLAVARTGPAVTGMAANLIPLFTAILSLVLLSEAPHWYHALGFVLIAGGLWLTAKAQRST